MTKTTTSHAFFYDSRFSQKEISECCGVIIDNRSHALINVLEEKYRKINHLLKNVLIFFWKYFQRGFFKRVPTNDIHNILCIVGHYYPALDIEYIYIH